MKKLGEKMSVINPFDNINQLRNLPMVKEDYISVKNDEYIYPKYSCIVYYDRIDKDDIHNFLKGYLVVGSKDIQLCQSSSQSFYDLGGINNKNLNRMIQEIKDESIYIYMNELLQDIIYEMDVKSFDNIIETKYKEDYGKNELNTIKGIKSNIESSKNIELNSRLLIKSLTFDEFLYFL